MTYRHLRRVAVATAVGAVALGSAAGTAFAAAPTTTATTTHTSLSIRATHSHLKAGASDDIDGTLHSSNGLVPGATIELYAATGHAAPVATASAVTNSAGYVDFSVSPASTTTYRLAYAGSDTLAKTTSGRDTVSVGTASHHRRHTSLSIREQHKAVKRGHENRVTGSLLSNGHAVSGRLVVLQARTSPKNPWREDAASRTGHLGVATFRVHPSTATAYRLVFAGGSVYRSSRSGVVTTRIAAPSHTSLSIRTAHSVIKPGDKDAISGALLSSGKPVAHRTITLMGRSGSAAWAPVTTARTGHRGVASFSVTPTSTEQFKLTFAGGPNYAACHSGTVTVRVS